PVEDFLFEYYSYRPALLRRWHPGARVTLAGEAARDFLRWDAYRQTGGGVGVDVEAVVERRGDTLRWIHELLARTAERPAHFGCFGMHEWAVVYREEAAEGWTGGRWCAGRRRTRYGPRPGPCGTRRKGSPRSWTSAASGAATSTR